jgi:alpha-mannosidase
MKKTLKLVSTPFIDPSLLLGESVVRRIIDEKNHNGEKSGKVHSPAINSGPLGYSRGIVQLLSDSGYTFYIVRPPDPGQHFFQEDIFEWIGFDGSSVMVRTISDHHESDSLHIDEFLKPSKKSAFEVKQFRGDLNYSCTGFFLSMNRLKPVLFNLEHKYYTAEKLFSIAAASGLTDYPLERMNTVMKEILLCLGKMTHDGKNIETTENSAGKQIFQTTAIVDDMVAALIRKIGNPKIKSLPGEYPFLIINPHPFKVDTVIEIEIPVNETDLICSGSPASIVFNENGEEVPSQCEKPGSSKRGKLRKKIAFRSTVPGGSAARYSCIFGDIQLTPALSEPETGFVFTTNSSKLVIDRISGFPSVFEFKDRQLLGNESMNFSLACENKEPVFSSLSGSVLISEIGPVRTIAESLFTIGNTSVQVRYLIPVNESYFDIEITVYHMEKDKILKWSVPVGYNMNCVGRAISGITCCKHRKREFVFRDWLGMKNFEDDVSLSLCANGAYSFDIDRNIVTISLLRGTDNPLNKLRFRFFPGNTDDVIDGAFNNSDLFNNPLIVNKITTNGTDSREFRGISISDPSINLQAVKLNEDGDIVVRLLNPCKETRMFTIEIPPVGLTGEIEIGSKKIKTLVVVKTSGRFVETDLFGRKKL